MGQPGRSRCACVRIWSATASTSAGERRALSACQKRAFDMATAGQSRRTNCRSESRSTGRFYHPLVFAPVGHAAGIIISWRSADTLSESLVLHPPNGFTRGTVVGRGAPRNRRPALPCRATSSMGHLWTHICGGAADVLGLAPRNFRVHPHIFGFHNLHTFLKSCMPSPIASVNISRER